MCNSYGIGIEVDTACENHVMPITQPLAVRARIARWTVAGLLLLVLGFAGWLAWPRLESPGIEIADGAPVQGDAGAINLAQGWSHGTQANAWFTSFGSRLLPYDWFLALEQPDSDALFRDDVHLRSLGFLTSAATPANPDALPVGVVRAPDRDGAPWVGLGCAACHTGEIRYENARIRIAGGAGMIDLGTFELRLVRSLLQTRDDPRKFARFAARVLPPGTATGPLRAQLQAQVDRLQRRLAMNATDVPYGPGRMDAFGQIFNAAGVDILGIAANAHPPDAPVSIPVLWDTPRLAVVQWNGSSPNGAVAALAQNVTTALGVYGELHFEGALGYASNADIDALGRIQQWNGRLRSPRWPEKILGTLDPQRLRRGESLYAAHCEACHRRVDRNDPAATPGVVLTPVDAVGTDPLMADNFATREGATGALQGKSKLLFGGDAFGPRARMIDIVVHLTVGAMARHPLASARATVAGRQPVQPAPTLEDPRVYKARPLDGVWASAPYLHNGSVPTLHDLLLPPAERPATFRVAHAAFDPVRVGLSRDAAAADPFDTSRRGNGNGGHVYGTDLDSGQRLDLVEYLKSL
jgi:hypothetical protein